MGKIDFLELFSISSSLTLNGVKGEKIIRRIKISLRMTLMKTLSVTSIKTFWIVFLFYSRRLLELLNIDKCFLFFSSLTSCNIVTALSTFALV